MGEQNTSGPSQGPSVSPACSAGVQQAANDAAWLEGAGRTRWVLIPLQTSLTRRLTHAERRPRW